MQPLHFITLQVELRFLTRIPCSHLHLVLLLREIAHLHPRTVFFWFASNNFLSLNWFVLLSYISRLPSLPLLYVSILPISHHTCYLLFYIFFPDLFLFSFWNSALSNYQVVLNVFLILFVSRNSSTPVWYFYLLFVLFFVYRSICLNHYHSPNKLVIFSYISRLVLAFSLCQSTYLRLEFACS